MANFGRLNNVGFDVGNTPGTGSIDVGARISNAFLLPSETGVVSGRQYTWRMDDGLDVEVFRGTYTSGSPNTISRDTVLVSIEGGSAGTSKIDASGNATVRAVSPAEDVPRYAEETSDPTVNDDANDGYAVGSRWLNTSTGQEFRCFDATAGSAVWIALFSRVTPTAASESSGNVTLNCLNGRRLFFTRTAGGNETIQDPTNMPVGATCYLDIHPNGNTISWDTGYVAPVPDIANRSLIAIVQRSSGSFVAVVAHEEE